MNELKKSAAKPPVMEPPRMVVLPPAPDRLQHFDGDPWGVRLAALFLETLPHNLRAIGMTLTAAALIAWKLWP